MNEDIFFIDSISGSMLKIYIYNLLGIPHFANILQSGTEFSKNTIFKAIVLLWTLLQRPTFFLVSMSAELFTSRIKIIKEVCLFEMKKQQKYTWNGQSEL